MNVMITNFMSIPVISSTKGPHISPATTSNILTLYVYTKVHCCGMLY